MSLTFDPQDIVQITQTARLKQFAINSAQQQLTVAGVRSLSGAIALTGLSNSSNIDRLGGTSGNLKSAVITPRGFGGLVFDAIFEESHTSEIAVTDNPVETGVSITDHAFKKPDKVRISAGVSNTPVVNRAPAYGNGQERTKNAWEALRKLQSAREPFDVQTGLTLYKNMVCTSLSALQDKDSSGSLMFTAELREIQIVYTQAVQYPPRSGKADRQAGKKKESGQKQATEVAEDTPQRKSALKHVAAATSSVRSRIFGS